MYIIFGSKKNVYKSIPVDGIDIIEMYHYKFYGKVQLELNIGKVNNIKSKIKFFGNFNSIDAARNEIKTLISYGNLNTDMIKIF
jgi:hypothetical protein